MCIRDSVKAVKRALVVVDLPFGSYQSDPQEALRSAIRIMKESGAHAVKLEGGSEIGESIDRIIKAGIPVMGHLGLVPRKSTWRGGLRAVGRTANEAMALMQDFRDLENAGAYAAEIEVVPHQLASFLSSKTSMILMSLGSGKGCDTQFLFSDDILGDYEERIPRHAKAYRDFLSELNKLQDERINAFKEYIKDVEDKKFPSPDNLISMDENLLEESIKEIESMD